MNPAPPFGLLLIGGNHTHQETYARAFAADPRCRLIGLADEAQITERRRRLNQDLADQLGIPYLPRLDSALRDPAVHFVSICAEPERRVALTISCARAGKHLYLDKDPAPTLEEARQIEDAIRGANVLSQCFSLVRSPAAQRAKAMINSAKLGRLVGLHCDLTFAKGISGTADLSTPRVEKPHPTRFTFIDSKREFLCVGYYPLILIQWLTGNRVRTVDATTSNYFFAEHQRNNVEDFACALLSMDDGLEVEITAGRCGWMSHRHHGFHDIRLVGTQGTATLDGNGPRLEVYSDGPPWQEPQQGHPEDPMGFWASTQAAGGIIPKSDWFPMGPAVQADFSAFLDCLASECSSDVPVALAVHALEVVHAVYESAASNETVTIGR